ncbi:MAG: excinuclease ABC subunit UvrB [Planctomycetota bacterium]
MGIFHLKSPFAPAGEQPHAIRKLVEGVRSGKKHQTLLGVTGSGKTFVLANVIKEFDLPVLVISHNKTLCAQLYGEFKAFFPENAVEYFVSYYDYYQPEAYLPATDVYIEKDAAINQELDRLRLSATSSLMLRRDVIVVASVSCIYGLGRPGDYENLMLRLRVGETLSRRDILRRLVDIQYTRNDAGFGRGNIRVPGDAIEVWPTYRDRVVRIELFGDAIEALLEVAPLTGEVLARHESAAILPAKHFVLADGALESALGTIEAELAEALPRLRREEKLLEAQRLESRTRYDLEMLREIGYCQGIENYSRHFDGRAPGERPACLFDYFRGEFLLVVDESHVTIPQVRGMYNGDRSRKESLVEHGFRLPSALDNRPLRFDEFVRLQPRTIYLSATPAPYEIALSGQRPVELLVRPTGLVDPPIEVRSARGQVADILREVRARAERRERVLVTTITKRLAEDLDEYCREQGLRTMYLHSDIQAIERVEILKNLRLGTFDALIGVNLLREGLDLPEVSLVVILDADKEGFLRSHTSLMQIIGRTARHVGGRVILYADTVTEAMRETIRTVEQRREHQLAYNAEHGITPRSVVRGLETGLEAYFRKGDGKPAMSGGAGGPIPEDERAVEIALLEEELVRASSEMRFEDAALLRDRLIELGAPIRYAPDETRPPPLPAATGADEGLEGFESQGPAAPALKAAAPPSAGGEARGRPPAAVTSPGRRSGCFSGW